MREKASEDAQQMLKHSKTRVIIIIIIINTFSTNTE